MEDQLEEDENWGPKTNVLPEESNEPREKEDMAQMVNLGPDVPEHIHPHLNEVLHHNLAVFRVRGIYGT
jgi:hypothetical protein